MASEGRTHNSEPDDAAGKAAERQREAVAELRADLHAGAGVGALIDRLGDLKPVEADKPTEEDLDRHEPIDLNPEVLLRLLPVDDRRRWREHLDELLNSMAGMRSELPQSTSSLADALERTRSLVHAAESDPDTLNADTLVQSSRRESEGGHES